MQRITLNRNGQETPRDVETSDFSKRISKEAAR